MKIFRCRFCLMALLITFCALPLTGFSADLCSSVFLPVDIAYTPLNSVARDLAFSIENIYKEYPSMSEVQKKSAIEFIAEVFENDPVISNLSRAEYLKSAYAFFNWKIKNGDNSTVSVAGFEVERFRLLLVKNNVDPTAKPLSWQKVFEQTGISYVQHETSLENLVGVLKDMKIKPRGDRKAKWGGEGQFIYIGMPDSRGAKTRPSLKKPGTSYSFITPAFKNAMILLSPKVLDMAGFSHLNGSWAYGARDPQPLINNNITVGLLNYMRNTPWQIFRPEWLITQEIDMRQIDFKLIINKQDKAQIERALSSNPDLAQLLDKIEWVGQE